jgi:hypothetical protein
MSTSCKKSSSDIWIFYLCMIYSFNIVLYLIVWCDHIIFRMALNIFGWYFKNKNFYLYPHNLIWKKGLCNFNVLRSLKLKGWEGYVNFWNYCGSIQTLYPWTIWVLWPLWQELYWKILCELLAFNLFELNMLGSKDLEVQGGKLNNVTIYKLLEHVEES